MTVAQKCRMCRQPLVPPSGPVKAVVGMVYFEPLFGRDATDATRVLTNELYQVGLNVVEMRSVSLWPHAPNKTDDFSKHVTRAIKAVEHCSIILLFGTKVTQAVLGEGISGILGLKYYSPLLPEATLIPCISPDAVPGKTLGEFRWVMQTLAKEVGKL